jgi:hypothetical protein
MATFADRVIGAAMLRVHTYEEVEADRSATGQALAVVLVASVAAGIGGLATGTFGLLRLSVAAILGWVLWAALIYFIGGRLLPEASTKVDVGELLRTSGFASAPGILRVLGFIPIVGGVILFVVSIWMLIAMVIAVRQALDYRSTGRAIVVCLIGWIVSSILFWLIAIPGALVGWLAR